MSRQLGDGPAVTALDVGRVRVWLQRRSTARTGRNHGLGHLLANVGHGRQGCNSGLRSSGKLRDRRRVAGARRRCLRIQSSSNSSRCEEGRLRRPSLLSEWSDSCAVSRATYGGESRSADRLDRLVKWTLEMTSAKSSGL